MDTKTDNVTEKPTGAIMSTPSAAPAPKPRRLHPAVLRLAAVALLFAAWLGYLAYLVVTMPHTASGTPLILSRSQFLVSEVDVIAQIDAAGEVTVEEILFPKQSDLVQVGQKIKVVNLALCKPPPREGEKAKDVPPDFQGAGAYLLPLQHEGDGFKVAPTPPSPGYPPSGDKAGPPRIYPATEAAKAQYRTIKKS